MASNNSGFSRQSLKLEHLVMVAPVADVVGMTATWSSSWCSCSSWKPELLVVVATSLVVSSTNWSSCISSILSPLYMYWEFWKTKFQVAIVGASLGVSYAPWFSWSSWSSSLILDILLAVICTYNISSSTRYCCVYLLIPTLLQSPVTLGNKYTNSLKFTGPNGQATLLALPLFAAPEFKKKSTTSVYATRFASVLGLSFTLRSNYPNPLSSNAFIT